MIVVSASVLVLNHHPRLVVAAAVQTAAEDIGAEASDCLLGSMRFQRETQRLTQARQVLGLRQPGREMLRFFRPDRSQIHGLKRRNCFVRHG